MYICIFVRLYACTSVRYDVSFVDIVELTFWWYDVVCRIYIHICICCCWYYAVVVLVLFFYDIWWCCRMFILCIVVFFYLVYLFTALLCCCFKVIIKQLYCVNILNYDVVVALLMLSKLFDVMMQFLEEYTCRWCCCYSLLLLFHCCCLVIYFTTLMLFHQNKD